MVIRIMQSRSGVCLRSAGWGQCGVAAAGVGELVAEGGEGLGAGAGSGPGSAAAAHRPALPPEPARPLRWIRASTGSARPTPAMDPRIHPRFPRWKPESTGRVAVPGCDGSPDPPAWRDTLAQRSPAVLCARDRSLRRPGAPGRDGVSERSCVRLRDRLRGGRQLDRRVLPQSRHAPGRAVERTDLGGRGLARTAPGRGVPSCARRWLAGAPNGGTAAPGPCSPCPQPPARTRR